MSKADERHDVTVKEYISSIDDETMQHDAKVVYDVMYKVSGEDPILYGFGTIGFGVYKYEYTSGRKGEAHILGFYPRKGKMTIYLSDGTKRYATLLSKLGPHTVTGYCIYVKRLSDIDLDTLAQILDKSYAYITKTAKAGLVDHILWRSEI